MGQALLRRERSRRGRPPASSPDTLRLVTYNVHSCVGIDGRLSPARIARVLAGLSPDVVALQELDVCRPWTGCVDQAAEIARDLEMELHFHPCINVTGEQYGNAILSRYPIQLIKSELFPDTDPHREPRGAMWVRVDAGGQSLDVISTHLGLSPRERIQQIEALLGREWLAHPDCGDHAVLCGDLNAMPGSRVYRRIARQMRDAQRALPGHRPRRTWFSPFPLSRIDHVFVSPSIDVDSVDVPRTAVTRVASDHLPLSVVLRLAPSEAADDARKQTTVDSWT
ncbi:MAG: EEP domain-containing protein [Planctomycetota bacterium]|nr:MAG: EEP domain-containing protein [Planctomycetota bacterium]REJ94076.1 MAG: EEP domain-containing protein [Planctomycetota bacterium]